MEPKTLVEQIDTNDRQTLLSAKFQMLNKISRKTVWTLNKTQVLNVMGKALMEPQIC